LRISLVTKVFCLAFIAWTATWDASAQTGGGQAQVIWIAMEGRTQLKKTAEGTTLEGKLARNVYWRDTEIFPKGSTVHMVVDHIESRKKPFAVDDRPFVIHLFAPRHDVTVRFRSVNVLMPGGSDVPLRATFVALTQRAELSAETENPAVKKEKGKTDRSGHAPKKKPLAPWILTLQAEPERTTFPTLAASQAGNPSSPPAVCVNPCALPDGLRMPVALLEGLSASKNRQGQEFRAVLLEPVLVGSTVAIPQGSILQGVLVKRIPPRRLYRPGMLNLMFNRLALPNGTATMIAASPVAAEVDRGTHMTMDSEGKIHAQSPGTARFLLDFGVTGGISKVTDDTTQLIIEAISSTATDASTAGVGKFAALGATAIYLLTRHGRDVILPPYTEMDVSLSRAVSLETVPPATSSPR
jgi:hypothetical protein